MAGADDMISSFFYANPTGEGMTYEQLKARRALAAALASKSRDYPNTLGKGIFSLGESIGEGIRDYKLDAEEKRIRAGDKEAFEKNKDLLRASPDTAVTPPVGPPGPPAAPPPRADAGTASVAELSPEIDLSRAQIAQALASGAQGSRPAAPAGMRMASLPSAGTMSDAGQPGLTYGGPQPAGPGASMAEPPDQAPPAPSAPPPMQQPGPGATDTPPPAPGTGGGVSPQMGGGLPNPMGGAGPGVSREMLAQTALANQGANPDAPGPVPPGGGVPPQMLAQVGGFGGGRPGGAMPAPPVGGAPPGAMSGQPLPPGAPGNPLPPGGVRPDTSLFTPPTQQEFRRQYGPDPDAPKAWPNPELRDRYNRAMSEALNPSRSDTYRKQMENAAARISAENDRIFKQNEDLYKQQVTRRGSQYDELNKKQQAEFDEKRDPTKIAARDQAIADHQLSTRAGNIPAAEVHKELRADQDNAKTTAKQLEDYTMALDAMKKGVFVGAGSATRLDLAKFGAWATDNKALSERAGNTEILKAKLLSTVSSLVKDIKPISNVDILLGKQQAGDINMEPGSIKALLDQTVQRGYRDLATYDSKVHSLVNGLGTRAAPGELTPLEARYKAPEATWYQKGHLNRLFEGMADPSTLPQHVAAFNNRYGPGAAEFVLNRKKLNPSAR